MCHIIANIFGFWGSFVVAAKREAKRREAEGTFQWQEAGGGRSRTWACWPRAVIQNRSGVHQTSDYQACRHSAKRPLGKGLAAVVFLSGIFTPL